MRIGLDAHILGKGKGGVERVVHHYLRLVPDLLPEHQFIVFVNRHYRCEFPARPNVTLCPLAVSDPLLQRSFILPWLARKKRLDLLHVQRIAPPRVKARIVLHAHDLLPLTAPEDHRGFRDGLVRRLMADSVRRAHAVLTVSDSAAAEIQDLFPSARKRVTAIPNGIEAELFRPPASGSSRSDFHHRLNLPRDYVLYLGALMARKNLEVVLHGFAQYLRHRPAAAPPVALVLAGMSRSDAYTQKLRRLADELVPGAVRFTGFITDQECVALLQSASLFLAPSRGEGFDLPALEAMACGIPVIASEIPVHREILGDDALYFPHPDPERLAACLALAFSRQSLCRDLVSRGLIRARRYTWQAAAEEVAAFYQHQLKPSS